MSTGFTICAFLAMFLNLALPEGIEEGETIDSEELSQLSNEGETVQDGADEGDKGTGAGGSDSKRG